MEIADGAILYRHLANGSWGEWTVIPGLVGASSGPAAGGNTITVIGLNFFAGTTVTVNGASVSPTLFGSSSMTIVMPAGTAGPAQVTITSQNGCSASATYTYL